MRVLLLSFFLILILISCKSSSKVKNNQKPPSVREQISEWRAEIKIKDKEIFIKVDSLLKLLFNSKYDNHIYSTSNPYFDELRYYYSSNLKYERYIYRKVLRPKILLKGDAKKWSNAIMLLPKKDCKDGDIDSRFYHIIRMVDDTSDISISVDYITEIASILREPCAHTLNQLQTDINWRKDMYNALIKQLQAFDNSKETYVEEYYTDIYEIMYELPDSLTSDFAYNYLINNDNLPEYLESLIDKRMRDWGPSWSFNNYSGKPILYSEEQVTTMIKRAEEIKTKDDCDWCDTFIFRLKLRFKNNW